MTNRNLEAKVGKRSINRPFNAADEFRDAYQSFRLFIRAKKRKKLPSAAQVDPRLKSLHLDCKEEVRAAIQYAHISWTLNKWPDSIEGVAQRKLIRKRDEKRRTDERKILSEIIHNNLNNPRKTKNEDIFFILNGRKK